MALLLLRAPRPRQTGLWPNEPSRLGAGPARGAEGAAHAEPPLLGLAGNHLVTLARSRGLFRARTPAAGPSQGFCGPPVQASPKVTPRWQRSERLASRRGFGAFWGLALTAAQHSVFPEGCGGGSGDPRSPNSTSLRFAPAGRGVSTP